MNINKSFPLILIVAFLAILTACSDSNGDTPNPSTVLPDDY